MPPATHCLALVNAGILRMSPDAPEMVHFFAEFDRVYAAAAAAPGHVWHLPQTIYGADAEPVRLDPVQFEALGAAGQPLLVNVSVWRDAQTAREFVYRAVHGEVLRENRRRWFDPLPGGALALWWVAAGALPGPEEGLGRLLHLHRHGPSAEAFTFAHPFPAPVPAPETAGTAAT
jgi:hypothetical protein